jgi:deoxycytidylate deaminase
MTNRYPYLPEGRTIAYVSVDDKFMAQAKTIRDNESTDHYHSTGAVVVSDGIIVGRGANQSILKNPFLQKIHKNYFCIRRILKVPSGQKYWLCPGCASSSQHAESRAVRNALKNKSSIEGASLYLYGHWWCCKPCWDSMIAAGVKNVFLVEGADELFK